MDPPTAPQPSFGAVMVSLAAVVALATVLLMYHFLTIKLCAGRAQQSDFSPPIAVDDVAVIGISQEVLNSIPILSYRGSKRGLFRVDQTDCAVCLGELQEEEVVRLLPACRHAFHAQCIDEWFVRHSNCPICRSEVVTMQVDSHMAGDKGMEDVIAHIAAQPDANAGPSNPQNGLKAFPKRCASLLCIDRRCAVSSSRNISRSLSMDCSSQVPILKSVDLEHGHPDDSQHASPSGQVLESTSWRRGSFKWPDRGSLFVKSFSRLKTGPNGVTSAERLPM